LIFLFYVWECAEVVTLSYQINELREEVILLENKNRLLKARLYSQTNIANLDKIAREERGMVFPQNGNIQFLKVDLKESRVLSN